MVCEEGRGEVKRNDGGRKDDRNKKDVAEW